jgi:hypothetical protein
MMLALLAPLMGCATEPPIPDGRVLWEGCAFLPSLDAPAVILFGDQTRNRTEPRLERAEVRDGQVYLLSEPRADPDVRGAARAVLVVDGQVPRNVHWSLTADVARTTCRFEEALPPRALVIETRCASASPACRVEVAGCGGHGLHEEGSHTFTLISHEECPLWVREGSGQWGAPTRLSPSAERIELWTTPRSIKSALGVDVTATPSGLRVVGIDASSMAARHLFQVDDRIVAVDDRALEGAGGLRLLDETLRPNDGAWSVERVRGEESKVLQISKSTDPPKRMR